MKSDTDTSYTLKLLPFKKCRALGHDDPIRFYYWPVIGKLYRRRVEICLSECRGGERILEVGFGSGVTFLNLHERYREIHGLDMKESIRNVYPVFTSAHIATYLLNGDVMHMPYMNDVFDTVLLISVLEHLRPEKQLQAFSEIRRVLKPGGQVVYGVPVERPLMVWMFRILGYNIRKLHYSTEKDVLQAAGSIFERVSVLQMKSFCSGLGYIYEVGHFVKCQS
ncbi:MAG: class I SAM-dependent methyltransferase [Deltaproteobacteria bacterium]|nr:class I SAM-dependent methyltransferase [Deltaproteobacteria bacterium]